MRVQSVYYKWFKVIALAIPLVIIQDVVSQRLNAVWWFDFLLLAFIVALPVSLFWVRLQGKNG